MVWVFKIGDASSSNSTYGDGIVVDDQKNIFATGLFVDTMIDFDPGPGSFYLNNGNPGGYADRYILKLSQTDCDDFTLAIDSITDLTCDNPGSIFVSASNGAESYSYIWDSTLISIDSMAIISEGGIYQVTANDQFGYCSRSISFIMDGPSAFNNFDFNGNLVYTEFRPGFSSNIWLSVSNDGCIPTNGQAKLILDSLTTFTSAIPAPDSILGDTLIWDLDSIEYNSLPFTPIINTNTSLSAQIGDSVCFELIISPLTGDIDSSNNVKKYCVGIVNSYDPNDKQVYPIGVCEDKFILNDQLLTYTLRFQNTGNADAINIYLIDSLDSNLDINSVNIISQSHRPMITEVLEGNALNFSFDNIHLPDSGTNEPESHGYVVFEVRPIPGLPNGTVIQNYGEIYFDFNPPIITNIVSNTIIDELPICSTATIKDQFDTKIIRVFPNPAKEKLILESDGGKIDKIEIFNLMGHLVLEEKAPEDLIHVNGLTEGIYVIKVFTQGKVFTRKIIKNGE